MKNVINLIGNTPIMKLEKIVEDSNINIYAKLESFNPGGSIKDRISLNMIEDAEKKKLIDKSSTLIEPTSGNTGIGIAMISAIKGYRCVIVMPESMSIERKKLLSLYGAELILTPKELGMKGSIDKANEMLEQNNNYFMLRQFENPANPEAHRNATSKEILQDMNLNIDAFVCCVGTGGTITGVGEVLKSKIPNIRVIAVEPEESPVLSGGNPSSHKIQGIGAGFVPSILNRSIIDEIVLVKSEDAIEMRKRIFLKEGLSVGISSGAAICGCLSYANNIGKPINILTILPDTGERYLSN